MGLCEDVLADEPLLPQAASPAQAMSASAARHRRRPPVMIFANELSMTTTLPPGPSAGNPANDLNVTVT